MWLKLIRAPILEQRSRPILKRKVVGFWRPRFARSAARSRQPDAGFSRNGTKQNTPISAARGRTRRLNTARRTNGPGVLVTEIGILTEGKHAGDENESRRKAKFWGLHVRKKPQQGKKLYWKLFLNLGIATPLLIQEGWRE